MKLKVKISPKGDPLLVVIFEKDSNFDLKDLSWVPRLNELDKIREAIDICIKLEKILKN